MKLFSKFMVASALTGLCMASSLVTVAGPYTNGLVLIEARQYAQAINLLTPLANAGNAEAQFELAKLYISGLVLDGAEKGVLDPAVKMQGGDWLRRASDNGLMEAQREMHVLYIIQGYGVSDEEGKKYRRMAAEQGDAISQYFVGLEYRDQKKYDLARVWLEKAIYQGDENAAKAFDALPPALFPPKFSLYKKNKEPTSPAPDIPFSIYKSAPSNGSLTVAQIKKAEDDGLKAYVEEDYARAIKLWTSAANAGSAKTQTNLGIQYANGEGVERSKEQAMYWLEKAMAQNYEHAFRVVAEMYAKGIMVPKSKQKAYNFYTKASDLGSGPAAYEAGKLAESFGRFSEALALFRQGAKAQHAEAQAMLGLIYQGAVSDYIKRNLIVTDLEESMRWYLKSAQQDFPYSVYLVGSNYEHGDGVKKSAPLAKYWLKRGARAGDGACMRSLDAVTQAEVKKELFLILEASANRGDVAAQYRLAEAYKNGEGVEKSKQMAESWLIKAAEQNHSEAMLELAKMYDYYRSKGEITPKAKALYTRLAENMWEPGAVVSRALKAYRYGNFVLARTLGQPYADTGNKYAQDMMGRIYEFGLGVPVSTEKSTAYFRQASAQGLTDTGEAARIKAQYDLGFIYELNLDAPKQAAVWYRKAADQEHADALYALGVLYTRGHGVPLNKQKALGLFRRAYAAGNDGAADYIEITQLEMKRDQRIAQQHQTIQDAQNAQNERIYNEYQKKRAEKTRAAQEARAAQARTYTYVQPKRNKWSFRTLLGDVAARNANSQYSQPYRYNSSSPSRYGYSSASTYSSSSKGSYYSTYKPKPYVNPYTYRYKSAWEISGPKYYD